MMLTVLPSYAQNSLVGYVDTMISPNPASEQLMLQSSFEMQRVEIYAMDGRKAFEAPLSGRNSVVNIDQLLPGTYLVKIFTQAGSTTKKLVVR